MKSALYQQLGRVAQALASGSRLRSVTDLAEALAYVTEPGAGGTDVLFFSLLEPASRE